MGEEALTLLLSPPMPRASSISYAGSNEYGI